MSQFSLMIADSNADFRTALEQQFQDSYIVHLCENGIDALNTALAVKPDIIVLDLMLTELDGVSLIIELQKADLHPVILVVARFYTNYVLEKAAELGIEYIIRKPCKPESVAERVNDLCENLSSHIKAVNPHEYVRSQLKMLSFSTRHKGFEYLLDAIMLMCRNPDMSLTKELYPAIGAKYSSSVSQVERAMRTAISAAWTPENTIWAKLFADGSGSGSPKPSNGLFIERLAENLLSTRLLD